MATCGTSGFFFTCLNIILADPSNAFIASTLIDGERERERCEEIGKKSGIEKRGGGDGDREGERVRKT